MKVFGECFFYEYYLSIFVTATNKQIYLPMPNSSACRGKKQCAQCPKAVDNAIIYASHLRGFHLPARKCEENIIIFLLKGEVLVNSKEYAGTVLHAGEFILQAIGSKYEILAMTDVECVCYRFSKPEFFCEDRYNHIMKEVTPPLIFYPFGLTVCISGKFQGLFVRGEDLPGNALFQTERTCFHSWKLLLRL